MHAQVIEIFHRRMSPKVAGVQALLADFKVLHLAIECAVVRDRTRIIAWQDRSPRSGILQGWEQDSTPGTQQQSRNEYPKAQEDAGFPP